MSESVGSNPVGQSADDVLKTSKHHDLRTRIAYAIAQADGDLPGMEPDSWDYVLADAVIRELQLHEENGWFGPTNIPKHRYVTEWVADE